MRWTRSVLIGLGCCAVPLACGPGPSSDTPTPRVPLAEEVESAAQQTDPVETASTPETVATLGWDMEQELEDVTYRETKGTVVQWELHAERVVQRPNEPAQLKVVTLEYFNGNAQPTRITADEADYDAEVQDAVLRGNVRVQSSSGDVLESEELLWDATSKRITSEKSVLLRRGHSHIRGTGLQTSPNLEDAELFNVSGIIHDEELRG